jgi:FkbM family methyltransferase
MNHLVQKLFALIKEIPLTYKYIVYFKNWFLLFADWTGKLKNDSFLLEARDGAKFIIRSGTMDRVVLQNIVIKNNYLLEEEKHFRYYKNVIDIGGHIGSFDIHISKLSPSALIFSFEPEPFNFQQLIKNIKINNLEDRIIPHQLAVANTGGKIKLYLDKETFGHSTSISVSNRSIEINCITLKAIIEKYSIDYCDLLKMNAEGAEYDILLNLDKEILKRIKSIRAHCHTIDDSKNVNILETYLSKNGFICKKKTEFLYASNLIYNDYLNE